MADFGSLVVGERAYTLHRHEGRRYAIIERVTEVRATRLRTLPCYADGEVMLWFGTDWSPSTGLELDPPPHRPRRRLLLSLPAGVEPIARGGL